MEHTQHQRLSAPAAADWLALSLLPHLGARRLAQLRTSGRHWPDEWLAALSTQQRHYFHYLRQADSGPLAELHQWCHADEMHTLLYPGHPAWPALLDQLADPPPVLWAKGQLDCLFPPALAIVGTRRPTAKGRRYAHRFAEAIAAHGNVVVSGLALGIDGEAHQGALSAAGKTIAVLGCGMSHCYPRQHGTLQRCIIESGGLLLSEHPPATTARPAFFPRRNRLITGLSAGVLIVEATLQSGSLISARLALEQNREVFALPGLPDAPTSAGCHALIQQGAQLITSPPMLLAELGWQRQAIDSHRTLENDNDDRSASTVTEDMAEAAEWLVMLADGPLSSDQLALQRGCSISDVMRVMLTLEMEGYVQADAVGWRRLR